MRPPRSKARLLVIDDENRFLLIRMRANDPIRFPGAGHIWLTPGGGVEPGETHEAAALRELYEETGIKNRPLGPVALVRDRETNGVRTHDRFYVVRVPSGTPVDSRGTTAHERRNSLGHRWFTPTEIAAREPTETFLPDRLGTLAAQVVAAGGTPASPIRIY